MKVKNMEIKKPATIDEQIKKLTDRKCEIGDYEFAKMVLSRINYYRLTAYFLPFKTAEDTYMSNTTLEKIYQIHEFDCELRSLCFSAIEKIEIMLRVRLAYYHAQRYKALGYMCTDNFNKKHNSKKFQSFIARTIKNNKDQPFVKHHINNYDGQFPIWVIIELFTFGELSIFYSDMLTEDKKILSKQICHSTPKNMSSWLICLTLLRNYCAHSSRLYYTLFSKTPATPTNLNYTLQNRIFDYIVIMNFFYPDKSEWLNNFVEPLCEMINKYKSYIELNHIGFPKNWFDILREV